mmetsp:Transcript_61643/g.180146  ORF Transcript_61643/g.180146 Transcript_61643/m.180146 type:complete len:239 (-) Transcript_61643:42-758(-)
MEQGLVVALGEAEERLLGLLVLLRAERLKLGLHRDQLLLRMLGELGRSEEAVKSLLHAPSPSVLLPVQGCHLPAGLDNGLLQNLLANARGVYLLEGILDVFGYAILNGFPHARCGGHEHLQLQGKVVEVLSHRRRQLHDKGLDHQGLLHVQHGLYFRLCQVEAIDLKDLKPKLQRLGARSPRPQRVHEPVEPVIQELLDLQRRRLVRDPYHRLGRAHPRSAAEPRSGLRGRLECRHGR